VQCSVKPELRGHLWGKEKVVFQDRRSLKRGSIHVIFFYDRTEKGDLSIQVTAFIEVISLAGLTVHAFKNVRFD
jgi:hypothetical protein